MSAFKTIATGLYSGKFKDVEIPTSKQLEQRRLNYEKVKEVVAEEFGKAKKEAEKKPKEKNWVDADLANEIEWAKSLDLKEHLGEK